MDYEKKYNEALERAKTLYENANGMILKKWVEQVFPELAESEDERIRKSLIDMLKNDEKCYLKEIAWLEKQGEQNPANSAKTCKDEQKPYPYSGTSFDYDGHTWGMCARDNGVELLLDGELKAFLSLEKSFIYPIHSQPELAPKSALEAAKEEKFERTNIKIKDAIEVSSRMKYIDEELKPIAEFILNYASWNLHKDEWNQPVLVVPLFRVLDALIQRGKPYCGC